MLNEFEIKQKCKAEKKKFDTPILYSVPLCSLQKTSSVLVTNIKSVCFFQLLNRSSALSRPPLLPN